MPSHGEGVEGMQEPGRTKRRRQLCAILVYIQRSSLDANINAAPIHLYKRDRDAARYANAHNMTFSSRRKAGAAECRPTDLCRTGLGTRDALDAAKK